MKRASGVLMHVSMLWGDYSIGSFGKAALQFIDFLEDCGFKYWQVLPMGVTDSYNSPYKSYSAFAGNPYFLDLERLCELGLLTDSELEVNRQKTPYSCEYDILNSNRIDLLYLASKRSGKELRKKIENFCSENKHIGDFCKYMSQKDDCYVLCTSATQDEREFLWQFIQYYFFEQWKEIKSYANSKGISIIGDIPMYVSEESSDIYFNRELFEVDENGRARCVAGVPPDDFSEEGQLWGNPLYNWENMRKDNYAWWKERVSFNLKLFDALRIDHFRAFEAYWSIPCNALSAKEGKWIKGEGERIVDAIRDAADGRLMIAEDLGVITDGVKALVNYSGFYNTRVFQFAFPRNSGSAHIPHNYLERCVAYTGTHDNNTLLGYIMESGEQVAEQIKEYVDGTSLDAHHLRRKVIVNMLSSSAGMVIIPIQDLLGYGADTRTNTPGIACGNWSVRFTKEQIDSIDRVYYNRLNKLYER